MKKIFFILSIIFIVLSFFTQSCKKEKNLLFDVEIINGIKTVHNFRYYNIKQLELLEDLSIGFNQEEENYSFRYPRDIDADSKGNIYVVDYEEGTIKKYSPQGKHERNIGRKGQGPGEFEYLTSICIKKNIIYCADLMQREVELFDLAGNYLKTIRTEGLSPEKICINGNDEIFIGYKSIEKDIDEKIQNYYRIGKYLSEKKIINSFYEKKQFRYDRIRNREFSYTIPHYVKWAINESGNIYIGSADKYEVSVYSPAGLMLFKFVKDYQPFSVEEDTKKKALAIIKALNVDPRDYLKYLETYPILNSMNIDDKGRIWVELFQPSIDNSQQGATHFEIFTSEGKFLFSTIINKKNIYHIAIKFGYVYSLARDERGYLGVIRFKISNPL